MLLNNIDINENINKYINISEILLLRQSYKKNNNFKIYKYHNVIRSIKLYSKFNINENDDYKIELILSNNIRYINEDTIDILKKRGLKNIYNIKIKTLTDASGKVNFNNWEETTLHINILNNLLSIITKNYYNINSIDLYLYYLCLNKELFNNFENILINVGNTYIDHFQQYRYDINSIYRHISKEKYKIKEYKIETNYLILYRL